MPDEEPTDAQVIDVEEVEPAPDAPTTAALVKVAPMSPIVRPVASIEMVREAFTEYEGIRKAIVMPSDVTSIAGKQFVNKSGWRKLAVVMGVSSQMVERDYDRDFQGRIIRADLVVRAVAPNGRSMEGLGVCDYRERCCPRAYVEDAVCKVRGTHTHCKVGCDGFNHFSKPQHDIPATAFTRALNRACSDLFGFGEVSAEEIGDNDEPIDAADALAITAALNGIADEAQRRGAKMAFVTRFGKPEELVKGQLEQARRFCASNGAPVSDEVPEGNTGHAPTPPSGTPAQGDGKQASAAGGNGDGLVGSPPTPPANNPAPDARAPEAASEGAVAEPVPPRTQPPAAPAPSTPQQRQQIAIKCNELAAADPPLLMQGDKAELVGALTNGRTATTTEITKDEATKLISMLAFIRTEDLAMTTEADGRALRAITQRGIDFLAPLVCAPVPGEPGDSQVY